jgi:hypothetical protein
MYGWTEIYNCSNLELRLGNAHGLSFVASICCRAMRLRTGFVGRRLPWHLVSPRAYGKCCRALWCISPCEKVCYNLRKTEIIMALVMKRQIFWAWTFQAISKSNVRTEFLLPLPLSVLPLIFYLILSFVSLTSFIFFLISFLGRNNSV